MIHPTAQIDPGARLGARVSVGAFTHHRRRTSTSAKAPASARIA